MPGNTRDTSATIHQFHPRPGHPAKTLQRPGIVVPLRAAPRVVFVEAGSSWYHEAALRDEERGSNG